MSFLSLKWVRSVHVFSYFAEVAGFYSTSFMQRVESCLANWRIALQPRAMPWDLSLVMGSSELCVCTSSKNHFWKKNDFVIWDHDISSGHIFSVTALECQKAFTVNAISQMIMICFLLPMLSRLVGGWLCPACWITSHTKAFFVFTVWLAQPC